MILDIFPLQFYDILAGKFYFYATDYSLTNLKVKSLLYLTRYMLYFKGPLFYELI